MRENKKGFTLIELLAVIVILAIIALIATPIVLNMINSARKSAAKSSSLGFIDSIEYYAGFAQANTDGMDLDGYTSKVLPLNNVVCKKSGSSWSSVGGSASDWQDGQSCDTFMKAVEAKSKGKAPDAASISISTDGKVRATSWLKYGDFYCQYNGADIPEECSKTTISTDATVYTS